MNLSDHKPITLIVVLIVALLLIVALFSDNPNADDNE